MTCMTEPLPYEPISWPNSKRFAFTIFDDPDGQSLEVTRYVYSFLADLGFRTSIGVWPLDIRREVNSYGETCANLRYRCLLQELQRDGFEIGFHNAAPHSCTREEVIESLDLFRSYFGSDPTTMTNHKHNADAIYWGPARVGGWRRSFYNLATLGRQQKRFFGHVDGHPSFWGDICRDRIHYCRNFVGRDINTLRMFPWMPYFDPLRPYVHGWYAGSDGGHSGSFLHTLQDKHQDRLEAEGGACIMYTHFGHGFVEKGKLATEFQRIMRRLVAKNGWFVPVSNLLDFLIKTNGPAVLGDRIRWRMETRWLRERCLSESHNQCVGDENGYSAPTIPKPERRAV
jgi:hypothetical protein